MHIPNIFPIVLYNGADRWTAPTVLSELVEQTLSLGEYGVDVCYFPIILNALTPDYPIGEIARLLQLSEDEVRRLLVDSN